MKKKLTLKKLIIIGFSIIFIFGYARQIITMNRIEKEIMPKSLGVNVLINIFHHFKIYPQTLLSTLLESEE